MKNKREVLVKLFLSTLYLSAFTFGGGYVIVTLMKKKFGSGGNRAVSTGTDCGKWGNRGWV